MIYKDLKKVLDSMTEIELTEKVRVVKQTHNNSEWTIDRVMDFKKVRHDNSLVGVAAISELFVGAPVLVIDEYAD